MSERDNARSADALFEAVLTLKNKEECRAFFGDICTPNEIASLAQRYEVAVMLRDGKTYLEISEATGASTATISRVNRSLSQSNGGYAIVWDRQSEEDKT